MDHTDISSLNTAIDAITLIGNVTRIDKALRLAQQEMFITSNGGRTNVPDILFLLTDGKQTIESGSENPVTIANELRNAGTTIYALGMGPAVDLVELKKIAGGSEMVFNVVNFADLKSVSLKKSIEEKICLG